MTIKRNRVQMDFSESPTMTEQHHRDACNINNLMKRYTKTGIIPHVSQTQGQFLNAIDVHDFTQAQFIIANAKSMFEEVPSSVRTQFDNDPQKYIDFMSNPDNKEAIAEFGVDASYFADTSEKPTIADLVRETLLQVSAGDSEPLGDNSPQ